MHVIPKQKDQLYDPLNQHDANAYINEYEYASVLLITYIEMLKKKHADHEHAINNECIRYGRMIKEAS